jgi:Zn-dependent protease
LTAPEGAGGTRSTAILVAIVAGIVVLGVQAGSINLREDDVIFFALLIPSVILHEVSHGAAALAFGDDTAKRAGRLTLNPLAHIDPFGTIILPALLVLTTGSAFGYAKPVPVSPRRMRSPRNHGLLTSLAGPATNIVLALLMVVVLQTVLSDRYRVIGDSILGDGSVVLKAVIAAGLVNVILAAFNLIPIPPLDGSAVVERILPARLWPAYLRFRQYSMLFLLVIIFWSGGVLNKVFEPALDLWGSLIR